MRMHERHAAHRGALRADRAERREQQPRAACRPLKKATARARYGIVCIRIVDMLPPGAQVIVEGGLYRPTA